MMKRNKFKRILLLIIVLACGAILFIKFGHKSGTVRTVSYDENGNKIITREQNN